MGRFLHLHVVAVISIYEIVNLLEDKDDSAPDCQIWKHL